MEDLSLVATPGQAVAIVGPTGAGKTTVVNLIMRLYELDTVPWHPPEGPRRWPQCAGELTYSG